MTPFDIALSLGSVTAAGIGIAFVVHVVRTSGRDRPHDPEGVRRLIETTPRYRPDQPVAK